MKINLDELKPQWQMTKEDLVNENRELRIYIDKLERQLQQGADVFQSGNLEGIINGSKAECEQAEKVLKQSVSNVMKGFSDLMAQYKKYRQLTGEKPATKMIKINVNALEEKLKAKPNI